MKEESISTAKLFELNCLVTAVAVAWRVAFHAIQNAGWLPIVVDGMLAVVLFAFYGITRYHEQSLKRVIQWYLLAKEGAITLVWLCWGSLQSIWSPVILLIILIYMVVWGEAYYKKLALVVNAIILLLIVALQFREDWFAFNFPQYWASYTHLTLYISSMVALLLGIVNNRVEAERQLAQQQAMVLEQARKAAEQRRDLLMYLKDLQSDFFLEQDLQPSFDKLLQQLLEVTNSSYGFMGELEAGEELAWKSRTHAAVHAPAFAALPKEQQSIIISEFFKSVYEGNISVINNQVKETVAPENQFGLSSYLGIPVTYNYKMVGAIILTNRPTGYSQVILEELSPFISTYGSIIQNIRLKRAQKEYENELRQAKELAEQSSRLKSQFLTNISHELRTPLSLILGPINLLKKTDFQHLGEQQWLQQLNLIENNSKKMLAYIEDIVDLSKLNSGNLEAQPTTIDLLSFLEEIYQKNKTTYSYRKLSFSLKYELPQPIGVYIDAEKLEKIIDNLLSNAFKYTKDGLEEHVILQAQLVDKELQIFCCDSGQGISKEHFERIFNRFYQIEQPNESIFSGTGIGLALCKELSELLEVEISVQSQVGKGSCFTIHIPNHLLRQQQYSKEVQQQANSALSSPPNTSPSNSGKPSLLVIDDNRDMRAFLKQILQLDYQVQLAKNGREALELLKEHPHQFELIITDLMMPEMDGFTLIQHIQANAHINHLPIIVLTAKAQFDERLRNLRIGMDDYLTKPFEVEELQVMVKHLLKAKAVRKK